MPDTIKSYFDQALEDAGQRGEAGWLLEHLVASSTTDPLEPSLLTCDWLLARLDKVFSTSDGLDLGVWRHNLGSEWKGLNSSPAPFRAMRNRAVEGTIPSSYGRTFLHGYPFWLATLLHGMQTQWRRFDEASVQGFRRWTAKEILACSETNTFRATYFPVEGVAYSGAFVKEVIEGPTPALHWRGTSNRLFGDQRTVKSVLAVSPQADASIAPLELAASAILDLTCSRPLASFSPSPVLPCDLRAWLFRADAK